MLVCLKEIKIVLHNDKLCPEDNFTVYIDDEPIKNIRRIDISAINDDDDLRDNNGCIRIDKILSYTVQYKYPWFEEKISDE